MFLRHQFEISISVWHKAQLEVFVCAIKLSWILSSLKMHIWKIIICILGKGKRKRLLLKTHERTKKKGETLVCSGGKKMGAGIERIKQINNVAGRLNPNELFPVRICEQKKQCK